MSPHRCLRHARLTLVLACSGLALSRPGFAAAPTAEPAAVNGPQLTVTEMVHDFGTVPQGRVVPYTIELRNTGNAPLALTDVHPTCGCTTTGDWPHSLAPGEQASIPVRFDTAHFSGQVIKSIFLTSNDPAHPQITVQLVGTIWTPISIAAQVLVFPGLASPNEIASRATTIRGETDAKLTLSDLKSESAYFKPALREIVPGREYELTVTTVPPLPEGTQAAKITMKTSLSEMPEVSISAVATVLPEIQVAPTQITLANDRLAAPEKRFAVLLNHRAIDLKVSDLTTDAPGVTLATTSSPDRKQFTVTLTFPAGFQLKPGQSYSLRGKTNHPKLPTFVVPIVAQPQ